MGAKRSFQPGADASKNSANKKPKMTFDSDDTNPQDLNNNKTKTKQAGVKKGSKKNIKQEPDTSDNSSNEMPKTTLDGDPLALDLNENKIKTEKDLEKSIKQE